MNAPREAGHTWTSGTALITGASKGLGRELALAFAKAGFDVIAHGRDEGDLAEVERAVSAHGVTCDVVRGELTDEQTLDRLELAGGRGGHYAISIFLRHRPLSRS